MAEPEEFLNELLDKAEHSVQLQILEPLPPEVRPELLKKSQVQVLTQKWLGENNLKLYRNWLHSWLVWMSSSGWKGPAFNEMHVHNLTVALEGDTQDLVMHYI